MYLPYDIKTPYYEATIMKPFACAKILGNSAFPNLYGEAHFYEDPSKGIWIEVKVRGLPDQNTPNRSSFYGMHIHEIGNCSIPFDKTGSHYNPANAAHPNHAGDLPPLLSSHGYAYSLFYTTRFHADEIMNRSLIIHSDRDDFTTQPAGNSGSKIGCGILRKCSV